MPTPTQLETGLETADEAQPRPRSRGWSWRRVLRRAGISVLGFGALVAGLALTVTPAPSSIVLLLGLAVLAQEYAWARRLLGPCRDFARRVVTFLRRPILRPALSGAGAR